MKKILLLAVLAACSSKSSGDSSKANPRGSGSTTPPSGQTSKISNRKIDQVPPPATLKDPPADAKKTPSGITYVVTKANATGTPVHRNDTVLLNYTGWKQATGDTFFTTTKKGQPMSVNLASAGPGLAEALPLFHEGETGLVWMQDKSPPGLHGAPAIPEMLVYQIEVMHVSAAPEVPADVAGPPADTKTLASADVKYVVVKEGKGKIKPRAFDTVLFRHAAWDGNGRMIETTEMRRQPAEAPPFRQATVMQSVMESMVEGERIRFWVDASRMAVDGHPPPGFPKGQLCYEVEIVAVQVSKNEPPPAPAVAELEKAPDDAKTTAHGVKYKILAGGDGNGKHPAPNDIVEMRYTAWHPDGRLVDSTYLRGDKPTAMNLGAVMAGLAEGVTQLSPGQKARMWIPDLLANKKAPARPQGDLVYDFELVSIKDKPH